MTDPISYSTSTPRTGLPLLFAGQTQKEVTVNEAIATLDLLVGGVEGVRNDPPPSPTLGEVWIVGSSPDGAFGGHVNHIAGWTEGGWRFVQPVRGMLVHDRESASVRLFDVTWKVASAPAAPAGGSVVDAEARAAIGLLIQALKGIGIFSNS